MRKTELLQTVWNFHCSLKTVVPSKVISMERSIPSRKYLNLHPVLHPVLHSFFSILKTTYQRFCSCPAQNVAEIFYTRQSPWVETGAFPWRAKGGKFYSRFPFSCAFCPSGLPQFQLRDFASYIKLVRFTLTHCPGWSQNSISQRPKETQKNKLEIKNEGVIIAKYGKERII